MSTASDRSHAAEGRLSSPFLLLVYSNAFITGAVVMGFEMLGSRYLNPFFGSGIYTWAALISTVLAALTAGYFFGGWMADRNPKPSGLGWLIVAGSAYLAFIPLFADGLLDLLSSLLGGLADQREFERWGSITGAMLLLFVPLALLGVYSPYAIRLTLRATARSGTVAGRIYGISTLGSIFGTLFVTFYLIPTMGSRHITYLLSAIGVAAGLSFLVVKPGVARRAVPAVAALLLAALLAPQPGQADTPPRLHLAQAGPESKEAAERFLTYLGKQGYEVRHDGIEAGPPPAGFRFKNFKVSERGKGAWRAAAIEIARFEERANGETAMTGFVGEGIEGGGTDKSVIKIARVSVQSVAWSKDSQIRIDLAGLAVRGIDLVTDKAETLRLASLDAARWRLDIPSGGALERLAARDLAYSGKGDTVTIAAIDAESIMVSLAGPTTAKNVALRDIVTDTGKDGVVRIAALELNAFEARDLVRFNQSGDIRALSFAIKGLEAPFDSARDPNFARDMKALGYTTLKMNAAFDYRYDEASKTYNLNRLEIDGTDMGAVRLAIKVGGITPEEIKKALEPPPPPPTTQPAPPRGREGLAAMGLLARLNLISADFSYRDKSLLGRVIKREAERTQTDEASIRAQYRALLVGLRDEQADALMKEAIDAVIAFLDNPGELLLEVRPPAPLNFLAIGAMAASSPAQLRTILGIKITATKP